MGGLRTHGWKGGWEDEGMDGGQMGEGDEWKENKWIGVRMDGRKERWEDGVDGQRTSGW